MNQVLREEKKFLITLPMMYELSAKFAGVLSEDEHNRGQGYTIRSLYFDSLDDRDYQEKEDGIELRRKIRLRCYGADQNYAMLEMKQKQGSLQMKRSLRVGKEDARQLIAGNYAVLKNYSEPFAAECMAVMQMHVYRPRAVVEYKRRAFIAKENRIRVTFDHSIIASESNLDIFSSDLHQYGVLNPYCVVLEVKYNGFLLSYIDSLLQDINRREISVSKYALSRTISKHYLF